MLEPTTLSPAAYDLLMRWFGLHSLVVGEKPAKGRT